MDNTLELNGQEVPFEPGQTLLQVAEAAGVEIPTLCFVKDAVPHGACRVCVVELEGSDGVLPACETKATAGLVVQTESARVRQTRKGILELLGGSDSNAFDAAAVPVDLGTAAGTRLRALLQQYGVAAAPAPEGKTFPLDDEHQLIRRDFSKCVQCGRCVAACNDVQVNQAIPVPYGRRASRNPESGWYPLADYDRCTYCGECVQACPAGALQDKKAAEAIDLAKAIDVVRTTCAYCGVGCQLNLHVQENRVVKVTGVEGATPNRGRLCVKGRFGYDFIHSEERLTVPLVKEGDTFRAASWTEALDLVAEKLCRIRDEHGGDSLAGLTSARVTNEENYLMQRLVRAGFGTNNIDHCARLCHSSTVAGLAASFGSGAMTNTIAEMERADALLITGSNTTVAHPVLATYIKRAVRHRGAELVVIDPRRIELIDHATLWLRQRPGTDIAVLNGLTHVILRDGLANKAFIDERCENLEALQAVVESYPPERVEQLSGVPAADLEQAAHIYGKAGAAMIIYTMGITQHTHGTDNVKCLANLAMLTGNIGRPSTGVNPLRGQNNVQGACDMGGLPNVYSGYQKVDLPEVQQKMELRWGTKLSPKPGLPLTKIIPAAIAGDIKGIYIMGENPAVSDPDTAHVRKALNNLEFLVVQDIFLTETARLADVVLPAACFAEKDGTFTNSERRIQRVRKAVEPPQDVPEDWRTLVEIGRQMGLDWSYDSAEQIFEEIAAVTPSYGGVSYASLEQEGGLQWPCPSKDHPGTPILHAGNFARGKGLFHAIEHQEPAELPDAEYPLMLTTGRVLYQYHTRTMTGRAKGLNDLAPVCEVELNPVDGERLGLANDNTVRIASRRGEVQALVRVTERVDQGIVFMPFHYAEAAANVLSNPALDPTSNIPEYKVCAVAVSPV